MKLNSEYELTVLEIDETSGNIMKELFDGTLEVFEINEVDFVNNMVLEYNGTLKCKEIIEEDWENFSL